MCTTRTTNNIKYQTTKECQLIIKKKGSYVFDQFFYDLSILYEFKKILSRFAHKELIFIDHFVLENYEPILNIQNIDEKNLMGMPNAIFYDRLDQTYTTVHYRYIVDDVAELKDPAFPLIYNKTIHLTKIAIASPELFLDIYNIILNHKCEFDTSIYTQYTDVDTEKFKILYELDKQFMEKEGKQIRDNFYKAFYHKDYSKFKFDPDFICRYHMFIRDYIDKKVAYEWVIGAISSK